MTEQFIRVLKPRPCKPVTHNAECADAAGTCDTDGRNRLQLRIAAATVDDNKSAGHG
jgi:hypothetical protein